VFPSAMSAELARRLLETGVVPADEIYAALSDAVSLGVPFVQALITRGPGTADLVDRELARSRGPVLGSVTVSLELTEGLPTGMCERLLAVPVGRSPNGSVEVAAVDPFDPAVGVELAHQLGAPVSIVRAPLGELLLALDRWLDERDRAAVRSTRTPAFGTRVLRRDASPAFRQAYRVSAEGRSTESASEHQSWPPIPLVRRSMPPAPVAAPAAVSPRSRVDTNPGVGSTPATLRYGVDETGTEVIPLSRSKAPPAQSSKPSVPREPELSLLDAATSAEELVHQLAEVAAPLAARALVLAQKGKTYESRASHPTDPLALGLRAAGASVLETALRDGHYLGRLPDDPAHAELARWLGSGEVYVTTVRLGERVPISLVLSGLTATLDSTRHADAVVRRAEQVLERILRDKKRGG